MFDLFNWNQLAHFILLSRHWCSRIRVRLEKTASCYFLDSKLNKLNLELGWTAGVKIVFYWKFSRKSVKNIQKTRITGSTINWTQMLNNFNLVPSIHLESKSWVSFRWFKRSKKWPSDQCHELMLRKIEKYMYTLHTLLALLFAVMW